MVNVGVMLPGAQNKASLARRNQFRYRRSVPRDEDLLAFHDKIEKFREVRFGFMDIELRHETSLVHFWDYSQAF
jgi:hypothetical protein